MSKTQRYTLSYMGYELSLFIKSEKSDLSQDKRELPTREVIQAEQRLGKAKLSRFIISRAFLRRTLGSMSVPDWCETPISSTPLGKPYIFTQAGQLWFNMAHTKSIMCVVFSRHIEVGVDIESENRVVPFALRHFAFSEAEQRRAKLCSDSNKEFLHYWVAKEAVLKCIGCGLTQALQSIRVERSDSGVVWACDVSSSNPSLRYFRLLRFPFIAGLVGYVAIPVRESMLPIGQQQDIFKFSHQWRLE